MQCERFKMNFSKLMVTLAAAIFISQTQAMTMSDPFKIDDLATPNPQTYWLKPPDLLVDEAANTQAASCLPNKRLSLAEITDFALLNSPDTRLAWYQAKAAAANVGIAESAYLPQIDAGAEVQFTANVFTSPHSSETTYGPNFSLSYLLLDLGNRSNTLLATRYAQMAANLNQNNAIQQVILKVQQSYYQALGQQALVSANQLSVKQAKTSLEVANALRQSGLETIGDVYQAQGAYAQAILDLQTAQGNYQTSLGTLATAMGLPVNTPLKLMPLRTVRETAEMKQSINQLLVTAKHNRPDLLSAEAQVRQSGAELAATRASILPTLTLNATAEPGGVFSDTSGTNVTTELVLSMPLFTGFSYTYQVKQAEAQAKAAQATRDQLNQQVQSQVWQNYFALQTAKLNISTTQVLLKSSLQASAQALGQYKSGVGDILSVLTTQTTLAKARQQSIQANLNWYLALAQLAASAGTLVLCNPI